MTPAIHVSITDDHQYVCDCTRQLLSSQPGFHVDFVTNSGDKLITTLEKAATLPHICILDVNMPGMNGYETLVALQKRWPAIKVLVLTMSHNETTIITMLRAGANGYLYKGTGGIDTLTAALHSIYNTGYYHSDVITGSVQHALNAGKRSVSLNEKDIRFLSLCCTEYCYKQIAAQMNVSPRTAEGYRDILFQKLGITTRAGLVLFGISSGFIYIK